MIESAYNVAAAIRPVLPRAANRREEERGAVPERRRMRREHRPPKVMAGVVHTGAEHGPRAFVVFCSSDFRQRPAGALQTIDGNLPRRIEKQPIGAVHLPWRRVSRRPQRVGFLVVSDGDPSGWPAEDLGEEIVDLGHGCEQVSERAGHAGRHIFKIGHRSRLLLRITGGVVPQELHPFLKKAVCEDADVKIRKPAGRRQQRIESVAYRSITRFENEATMERMANRLAARPEVMDRRRESGRASLRFDQAVDGPRRVPDAGQPGHEGRAVSRGDPARLRGGGWSRPRATGGLSPSPSASPAPRWARSSGRH